MGTSEVWGVVWGGRVVVWGVELSSPRIPHPGEICVGLHRTFSTGTMAGTARYRYYSLLVTDSGFVDIFWVFQSVLGGFMGAARFVNTSGFVDIFGAFRSVGGFVGAARFVNTAGFVDILGFFQYVGGFVEVAEFVKSLSHSFSLLLPLLLCLSPPSLVPRLSPSPRRGTPPPLSGAATYYMVPTGDVDVWHQTNFPIVPSTGDDVWQALSGGRS